MSEKKHIDRLFQEKLKDFEATPSDAVWQNISSQMHHIESTNKGIPRWWKVAGIAAGIVMLVTIGSLVFNSDDPQNEPTLVEDENKNNSLPQNPTDPNVKDASKEIIDLNSEGVVSNNDELTEKAIDKTSSVDSDDPVNSKSTNNSLIGDKKTPVASQSSKKVANEEVSAVANSEKENLKSKSVRESNIKTEVVAENAKKNSVNNNKDASKIDTDNVNKVVKTAEDGANTTLARTEPQVISSTSTSESSKNLEGVNTLTKEGIKVSLTEEIEKMRLDKLAEEDIKEDIQRWSISPNIAPVYFNSMGSGSSLDEQFNSNDKTGDINMSYGVVANYNFNKKLSIRAGVNQVKLGYSTNNVVVYNNIGPQTDPRPLRNVNLNDYGQTLSFLSVDGLGFAQLPGVVAQNVTSSIDQKLGFIEVPVELEYKLSDSKFGVSLIGGFSTLFLNENEVSTSLQGNSRVLGEATNVKETSFSANLGLGLNYNISEQFNLNLEPVFKYQLNTFTDTSGNFNPYFIGVYTGFSFRF